ncbi:MAG: phosphoribosylformylglycinamidine synthase subunit PurL [Paracoccaceae bacterium]|nr:phosphoribosylformylglycinamidine synthase subunit PurL [Paracoccaceae bacterium]
MKATPKISENLIKELGLDRSEFAKIISLLERDPTTTELGIFSAMWNEHCSYKSSKKWLKTLPTNGPQVICGPGENAGIVSIGDNQALVFKMESHNHPSFIEPFQGAATGMGGILRDVFTMGARPIATMNALSFGEIGNAKTKSLFNGVVSGIGSYGNCFGVPNVGGELRFNKSYNSNCLVNAFAAGIVDEDKIFYSAASGIGMPVVYLGAKTGRDGVGGASMASAEFNRTNEEKRPAVQVGDPFTEKCLMEACLELMKTDAIISIQDMGAAGLTCSAVEMGDKGDLGIELNLNKVPVREKSMTAFEMMLSESQERMLMVLNPKKEEHAKNIFDKWNLDFAIIGHTIKEDKFRIYHNGVLEADIPLKALSGSAPEYDRPWTNPNRIKSDVVLPKLNPIACLKKLIKAPNYCSRAQVWEQYDHTILSSTINGPGSDSALVKIKNSKKAIAFTCDVTPRYCVSNPYEGGKQAVAESYRNLISSGATPLAITDNLNFGNPKKQDIMGQLVMSIKGIGEASEKLKMPVVSGNVSLYNETDGVAIFPTPTIGAVGLLKDYNNRIQMKPKPGEALWLIGETNGHLGQSALIEEMLGINSGGPPLVDLEKELLAGQFLLKLNDLKLIQSCHDLSDGGLALAAAEMAIIGNSGITLNRNSIEFLFAEDQGRYLISGLPENENKVMEMSKETSIPVINVGRVGGEYFIIGDEAILLAELQNLHQNGLNSILQ